MKDVKEFINGLYGDVKVLGMGSVVSAIICMLSDGNLSFAAGSAAICLGLAAVIVYTVTGFGEALTKIK